jgi:hypothetical protein
MSPAKSKSQGRMAAMEEHHPGSTEMKGMTKDELHKMASTPEKSLPSKVKKKKG